MFVCLSVCLSVFPLSLSISVCLSLSLPTLSFSVTLGFILSLSECLPAQISALFCWFVYLSSVSLICVSVCKSVSTYVFLPVCQCEFICLSGGLCCCVSICLPLCISLPTSLPPSLSFCMCVYLSMFLCVCACMYVRLTYIVIHR